jgi:hypothetical protein
MVSHLLFMSSDHHKPGTNAMKIPRLKTILLIPVVLFALFYAAGAYMFLSDDRRVDPLVQPPAPMSIAIFGASGTAGDGILKAALASPEIEKIHLVTRRVTPRMEQGEGKVQITMHTDYLDYSAIIDQLRGVSAIYWAIGISSVGMDEEPYTEIHVDFPMRFLEAWKGLGEKQDVSFHYISSSDISADSSAMWARVKVLAEESLFEFAEGTNLRVIAYRPDYIGPTREEAHLGQDMVYWFFKPVGAAVRAKQIGQAMIDITARPLAFENGDKIGTWRIIRHSDAYEARGF